METNIKKEHSLNLLNRQKLDLTGVVDVISFNEDSVILNTKLGTLNIKGKNMRVNKLNVDNGDMTIAGEILSLVYLTKEASNKESLLKKLFK
ncbi:MAG TPA: sporulation protein YabP [Clostridiaceae bacterium]|jgi:sporulation protein YabP|nr:sporulation protein YabP [Clostridiaceae bacterium]HBN28856.1 sporulation protein YabP [Clostridiaceae bacterium]HBX47638.1 sporulation protein YabP [Clostridiaceae bacterium]